MKKRVDYMLLFTVICLCIFGLLMIYSSSNIWAEYKYHDAFKYVKNQSIFFIIGLVMIFIMSRINYHFYYKKANILILLAFIFLILVIIPGIGTVRNGSRSWFGIGQFGIQPSEAAKLCLIIFVAKYMSKNYKKMKQFKSGLLPILLVLFFMFGLIMLQPDFGTGFVLVMSIVGMIYVGGASLKFFGKLSILGIVAITILILIAPYRLARILSFLNPWSDPLGSGFQIIQSLYAIGPGGLFGLGFGNSIQKHFYLPEPQTDFIFSIISEEFGFVGCLIVVGLFILIIYTCLKIATKCDDLFGKYLSFGITFSIAFQCLLNLSVVVGLVPVTGVTLPFLSYGGSSLLITMAEIGIILNVSKKIR